MDAARVGEQAAIEALGRPDEYAQEVRLALADEPEDGPTPQGRVLGMPFDFRGASVERVGERVWNPADPRIFTPRMFGVGWTINFGAIAVKLGLIRPDDVEGRSFEQAPGAAVATALAIPALLALGTVVAIVVNWATLSTEVPMHWGASGNPDGWAGKPLAFGLLLVLTVLPVIAVYGRVLRPGSTARARVLSAAVLAVFSAIGLGLTLITIADARDGAHGNAILLVILGGLVLSFLILIVPVRLGLRAEWRESLGTEKKGM